MVATSKKRRDLAERESIFINKPIGVRFTCFFSVTQWISASMPEILLCCGHPLFITFALTEWSAASDGIGVS